MHDFNRFDKRFEEAMQDGAETEDAKATRMLRVAITEFLGDRGCSMTNGPPVAYFTTLGHGGVDRRHYEYRVLAQGGWKGPAETRGDGCDTFEDLRDVMIALLKNWTKPNLPVIVRHAPEALRSPESGKWFGYFRFVQLDFVAETMTVFWDIEQVSPAPDRNTE